MSPKPGDSRRRYSEMLTNPPTVRFGWRPTETTPEDFYAV
jgi:hypothetical protein